jgi:hypothetical protein
MIRKVLVAGATGYLGRHLVQALKRRGIWVRALVRHPERAVGLESDDVFQGEVTAASSLNGTARGVDAVLSSVGITRQREGYTYDDVDYAGNLNLLQIAEAEGSKAFMYVSLFRGQELQGLRIAAAKERLVGVLRMAHKGRVFVFGDGSTRINPISGRDIAEASVDASRILRLVTPVTVYGPIEFFLTVATQNMVAPPRGQDHLADFFSQSVAAA